MSASLLGNGRRLSALRTIRFESGLFVRRPGRMGFHCVAGASSDSSASLRGPVRRSDIGAICMRQFSAACSRSVDLISICTSFSASEKVAPVTCGPTAGEVPNAVGAPGVCWLFGAGGAWAASSGMAAPIRLADVAMRKSLRVCVISPLRLSATFSGLNIGREEIYSRLRR